MGEDTEYKGEAVITLSYDYNIFAVLFGVYSVS